MPRKYARPKPTKEEKEWPAVVYLWIFGLGFLSYLVVEIARRDTWPHPVHWLAGILGGIIGIGIGWLWYRWRGDVF
jgi:drug/metabolite transporter (DMT)-like permease